MRATYPKLLYTISTMCISLQGNQDRGGETERLDVCGRGGGQGVQQHPQHIHSLQRQFFSL